MKIRFLIFCVFFINMAFGQTGKISGVVFDETNGEKLDFATVTAKNLQDSSLIKGTKSKLDGSFSLDNLDYGTYVVYVSSIGYGTVRMAKVVVDAAERSVGKVGLKNSSRSLKNIVVVGEKPAIELGIDKKVFNVDKNITSAGGTAEDILRNVPSVNVDVDGNLSLRGKSNVNLLVDGKPSAMFGNDIATALQTIPAASIESIEVITNPGSKYDAQGMNGIINIILKKDRNAGLNGMFNIGVALPRKLNGGVNLNLKTGKWNLFLNANGRVSKNFDKTVSDRDNLYG